MNPERKEKIERICTTAVSNEHALFSVESNRGPMFTWENWIQRVGEEAPEWLARNPPTTYPRSWNYEEYQYAVSYSASLARTVTQKG